MRPTIRRAFAPLAALALLAAACSSSDDAADDAAEDVDVVVDGDLAGTTVSVFGAFVDEDAARFRESMAPFEEATGITVNYEGSADFENLIRVRAEGGDPPDIAMFPQPGLMADLARQDFLVPLDGELLEVFEANYDQSWRDIATVDGTPYGIWYRASVKSLVWYPVEAFEAAGYEIPQTWDELLALSDQIVADGGTPWCVGIESSGATGWVATDWVEDIMLRLHGAEVYDEWVSNDMPFDDPRVLEAVEVMGDIWLDSDYVRGGTQAILTTPFGDSPLPLFDDPPGCYMHRQASFITAFFPDDVQATLATDNPAVLPFYLPAISDEFPNPVLGAGDVAGMFNDRPEVRALMAYLATPESGNAWAAAGGFLWPHQGADLSLLPTEAERIAGEILAGASEFRFDASDLMPAEVGTGSFWSEMVNYVNGKPAEQVLVDIQASWPSS